MIFLPTDSVSYDDTKNIMIFFDSATVIGVGSQSFLGDNHVEVAGSILTAGE